MTKLTECKLNEIIDGKKVTFGDNEIKEILSTKDDQKKAAPAPVTNKKIHFLDYYEGKGWYIQQKRFPEGLESTS